jgi:hypothetical protein
VLRSECMFLESKSRMFHASTPTLFGRTQGVLAETEALHSTLAGLRRTSDALLSDGAPPVLLARRLLATLSASLMVYFDADEAQGYFSAIVAECPDLEDRVMALDRDRDDFRHCVTSVRRLAFRSADTDELGRRIRRVVDRFEEHERSESDLLQTFFREEGCARRAADPA